MEVRNSDSDGDELYPAGDRNAGERDGGNSGKRSDDIPPLTTPRVASPKR